jgi:hypothetical protein
VAPFHGHDSAHRASPPHAAGSPTHGVQKRNVDDANEPLDIILDLPETEACLACQQGRRNMFTRGSPRSRGEGKVGLSRGATLWRLNVPIGRAVAAVARALEVFPARVHPPRRQGQPSTEGTKSPSVASRGLCPKKLLVFSRGIRVVADRARSPLQVLAPYPLLQRTAGPQHATCAQQYRRLHRQRALEVKPYWPLSATIGHHPVTVPGPVGKGVPL